MSKASNQRKNASTIDYAFKRFKVNAEATILDGMEKLAHAALDYLIDAHNNHAMFMAHTTQTDTMAWALAHNGQVRRSGYHNGGDGDLPGSASVRRVFAETPSGAFIKKKVPVPVMKPGTGIFAFNGYGLYQYCCGVRPHGGSRGYAYGSRSKR